MYAIVRGDLDMPPGKLSAQAGHAYTDSLCNAFEQDPQVVRDYRNLDKGGSKVTVKAKNLNQLLRAFKEAKEAGLPCALIVDQHHILPPHFDGNPIVTAVGIGPCTKEECRQITKRYRCI
jgi:peptidyl-tRNA hydrolase